MTVTMSSSVVIGDLHFGALDTYFPNQDADAFIFEALDLPFEYAYSNGINHVIFLGDIWHNPIPSQSRIIRLLKYIKRKIKRHAGLRVDFVMGNHDYTKDGDTSFNLLSYVGELGLFKNVFFHLKPSTAVIEKTHFQFLPWPHYKRLPTRPSVIIAHITLNGTVMNSGYKAKNSIKVECGDDLWVVGDIHQRGNPQKRFYYPGTLYQTRFDEQLPKGFCVLNATTPKSGKVKFSIDFHPIDTPHKLIELCVEKASDFDKLSTDRGLCYKVFVAQGLKVPDDLRTRFPNIWALQEYKSKKDLEAMQDTPAWVKDFIDSGSSLNQGKSVTIGLKKYLKAKGLKPGEVKQSVAIIKNLLSDGT